jgi:hypothetical protein
MCISLHVKYPLLLSDFNETWIFLADFRKILKYQTSRKSVQWEQSCSTRAGGRADEGTDMAKLIVALRNFGRAPNNRTKIDLEKSLWNKCVKNCVGESCYFHARYTGAALDCLLHVLKYILEERLITDLKLILKKACEINVLRTA